MPTFLAGVIWRGDTLIDGVPETLDLLRSMVTACRIRHGKLALSYVLNDDKLNCA